MMPQKTNKKKWVVLGLVGLVTLTLAAVVLFFMIRADQEDKQQVIYSDEKKQDNGAGIALPGVDSGSSGNIPLGAPNSDPNSASISGKPGTSGSSGQQSQQQSGSTNSSPQQPPKPVRSQTLENGLKIDEYNYGQGERATKSGDTIAVHYIGYLTDGNVFDTSLKGEKKPFAFKLGAGQVIQGWDIGLQDMHVGAVRRLTIPATLAYGSRGAPPSIPPNAVLVFDVQLMGIQ